MSMGVTYPYVVTAAEEANFVTKNTTQTITANKEFTGNFSYNQANSTWSTITDSTATITVNWNNGVKQKLTLGGARTLAYSNARDGATLLLKIIQDGTGGRTVTWPANTKHHGGAAPTLSTGASKVDLASITYDSGAGRYETQAALNYA